MREDLKDLHSSRGHLGQFAKRSGGRVTDSCADAKLHEAANDYDKARKAYADCLATGVGHVDTHAAYQKILSLEEGEAGALAVYAKLAASNDNVVTKLAHARLLARSDRIAKLPLVIEGDPDFAPAYYELSLDYSAERNPSRSLSDQAQEKKLLDDFLSRAKGKDFVKHFVDYDNAQQQIRDAESRLARLTAVDFSALDNPVTMTATPGNQGWMLCFQIKEPSTSIFYRLRDEKEFTKIDGVTVTVPLQRMSTAVYIKYEDSGGVMRGPFEIMHEPRSALAESTKKILQLMPTSWVSLLDFNEKTLLYWTILVTYRCALQSVAYGVDSMTPTQSYDPGDCDPAKPYEVTGDAETMYAELPPETKFVSIQLVYTDGTKSKVRKFTK